MSEHIATSRRGVVAKDLDEQRAKQARLREQQLVLQSPEWGKFAEMLRTRRNQLDASLRDYTGGDWRELGQRQGRLLELDRILSMPADNTGELAALAVTISKLELQLRSMP